MTILLGSHNVKRFGPLRFWAERGLICIEDERDNSYKTESVREMLVRMQAMQDMLRNKTDRITGSKLELATVNMAIRAEELQTFLEEMIEVVRQAREQGVPFDKSFRHFHRAARPLVSVPSGITAEFDM